MVEAAVVAGSIVVVGRLDAAPAEMDVAGVGAWVLETDVVVFPAFLLPLGAVEELRVTASTTDGFKGDGVCVVSYAVGIDPGAGADV